nr:uncharacterized protein LOC126538338 [Dermacentor andersoni]
MSGVQVCGCLNWSVHCQEVQPCDVRHLAPAGDDPFFRDGVVCAKLALQGITKRHSFLESVRSVGEWEVHSCQGCQRDVYAQASDRSLLLSADLEIKYFVLEEVARQLSLIPLTQGHSSSPLAPVLQYVIKEQYPLPPGHWCSMHDLKTFVAWKTTA